MRVIIASTGIGGHLTSSLALADELNKTAPKIDLYLTVSKNPLLDSLLKNRDYKIISFDIKSRRGGESFSLQNLLLIIELVIEALKAVFLIIKIRPQVAVGFGGYVSGPIILICHFLSVPTIIHEQNLRLGRTNRLLSRFTDAIALSFQETKKALAKSYPKKRIIVTGNPLRNQFLATSDKHEARADLGLRPDRFTILVMGGSQGSLHINQEVVSMLRDWSQPPGIQIIHITGSRHFDSLLLAYQAIEIPHKVFAHLGNIRLAYQASDLVISRAGATTLAELSILGIPAILIPYPYAKFGHQLENALFLREQGASILIEDDKLNPAVLKRQILGLINSPQRLIQMQEAIQRFAKPGASADLAEFVLSYLDNG